MICLATLGPSIGSSQPSRAEAACASARSIPAASADLLTGLRTTDASQSSDRVPQSGGLWPWAGGASVYVENATNEAAELGIFSSVDDTKVYSARPRTIGLKLTGSF